MSHSHRHRRREEWRDSHYYSHEHLERSFGHLPSNYDMSRGHLWVEDVGSERNYDELGPCPVHGSAYSTHSIWRPVQQSSRESRQIFENENRPPCPIHKRPASVASSESIHTAIFNDEILSIDPEPEPEPKHEMIRASSRHSRQSGRSKRSKHSKRSESRHTFNQRILDDDGPVPDQSDHPSRSGSRYHDSDDNLSSRTYSTGIS